MSRRRIVCRVSCGADDLTTYTVGGSWGDRIELRGDCAHPQFWPRLKGQLGRYLWGLQPPHCMRVHGWKTRRPRPGDILRTEMTSGRHALWRFVEVKLMSDPDDMFFGVVEFVDYETASSPEAPDGGPRTEESPR